MYSFSLFKVPSTFTHVYLMLIMFSLSFYYSHIYSCTYVYLLFILYCTYTFCLKTVLRIYYILYIYSYKNYILLLTLYTFAL